MSPQVPARRFITSDTHLSHKLMVRLRGFSAAEAPEQPTFTEIKAHDDAIIESWNAVVRPQDLVWHAGDVHLGSLANLGLVGKLNGTKILITGNHDAVFAGHRNSYKEYLRWMGYFTAIQAYDRVKLAGRSVMISHFPYAGAPEHRSAGRYLQYRLPDEGLMLLHGHTHSPEVLTTLPGGSVHPRMLHIGWDAWQRPVSFDEIAALIEGMPA